MTTQMATILKAQYVRLNWIAAQSQEYGWADEAATAFCLRVIKMYGLTMSDVWDIAA